MSSRSGKAKAEASPNTMASLMWPYSLFPWQQQFAFQSPIPYVYPPPNCLSIPMPSAETNKLKPRENPSVSMNESKKSSISQGADKLLNRRYSDPGPYIGITQTKNTSRMSEETNDQDAVNDNDSLNIDHHFPTDNQFRRPSIADETQKDSLLFSLMQELNTTRNINCQLMLELNKMKLQLELLQSEQTRVNEHQPGYISGLAQKLFDAHQLRAETISYLNQAAAFRYEESNSLWSNGHRPGLGSQRDKAYDPDEAEQHLLREKESLFNRLQATERKLQQLRLPTQWSSGRDDVFHPHFGRKSENLVRPSSSSPRIGGRATAAIGADYYAASAKLSPYPMYNSLSSTTSGPTSFDDTDFNGSFKQGSGVLGAPTASPPRRRRETPQQLQQRDAASYDASATEIHKQMALLERERRQLHQEYHSSMAALKVSEERATKLERLVTVLRKKLDSSTGSTISVTSNNESAGASLEPTKSRHRLTSIDGPGSLPSYTVGPITQL